MLNAGTAPIYRDAYVAVNGVRSAESRRLAPGKSRGDEVAAGGDHPSLEIQSDHLVEGQEIEFEANIKSN